MDVVLYGMCDRKYKAPPTSVPPELASHARSHSRILACASLVTVFRHPKPPRCNQSDIPQAWTTRPPTRRPPPLRLSRFNCVAHKLKSRKNLPSVDVPNAALARFRRLLTCSSEEGIGVRHPFPLYDTCRPHQPATSSHPRRVEAEASCCN